MRNADDNGIAKAVAINVVGWQLKTRKEAARG
jgi:hypothetical protein